MSKHRYIASTGDIVAQGKAGRLKSVVMLAAAATDTAVFRTGGASGDIVLNLGLVTSGDSRFFGPFNIKFDDGLHVTLANSAPCTVEYT